MAEHTPKSLVAILRIFAELGQRRPWWVINVSAVVAVAGLWGMSHLVIDSDLKALLPADYPSVTRLETLRDRIGTQSDLIVAIESPDREANLAFGRAIAPKLEAFEELRYVIFQRDLDYFRDHALLYLPLHDLLELRRRVIDRIREETEKDLVVDVIGDRSAPAAARTTGQGSGAEAENTDEEDDWLDKEPEDLAADAMGGGEVPSEFMEAEDGRIVVVKARPTQLTTNMEFSKRLVAKTQALITELNPASFHPEMDVRVRGEYLERVGESKSAGPDVWISALFAIGALMGLIALYFRRIRSVPIVLWPIVVSTVATLGLGAVIYGTFNIVTTFIFAILLGLGIDFGIHALARYRHEREAGVSHHDALVTTLESTGPALLYGAVTTAAVFFLLKLGHFQGFAQFGVMAGMGVVLGLLATFLVVPAMTTALERWRPWMPHAPRPGSGSRRPRASEPVGRRGWLAAWLVVALSAGLGAWALAHSGDIAFEYDFGQLGAKKKPNARDPNKKDYRDAVGKVTTYAPAVALCKDADECASFTRLLSAVDRCDDDEWSRMWGGRPTASKPATEAVGPSAAAEEPDPLDEDDPFGDPRAQKKPEKVEGSDEPADDLEEDDPFGDPLAQRASNEIFSRAETIAARLEDQLDGGKLLPEERENLRSLGPERLGKMREYLRGYMGLAAFVPDHQDDKLALVADIKLRIDRKRGALKGETREKIEKWDRYLEVNSRVTADALPSWVKEQLRESNGEVGAFTIVWNGGAKADYHDAKDLHLGWFDVPVPGTGAGPKSSAETVPLAANYFVLVEVIDTLKADGPVVLTAAMIAVLISLIVLFRSLSASALVLVPLVLSIGWLAGIYLLTGWKINMFSVVAFPLIVGMGIDDGIHIYHRWKQEPHVYTVMREVGGAVFMTTLTTCIGFAGLLFANHVGIQTLGTAGVLGMTFAFVGSSISLPALLYAIKHFRWPRS